MYTPIEESPISLLLEVQFPAIFRRASRLAAFSSVDP
jgi:hypothetical protein